METSVKAGICLIGIVVGLIANVMSDCLWLGVLVALIIVGAISENPPTSAATTSSESSAPGKPTASPEAPPAFHVPFPIILTALAVGVAVVWSSGSIWLGVLAAMVASCALVVAFVAVRHRKTLPKKEK